MHELGIVFHIIDSVEEVARANQVDHVQAVVLELGEVSGVLPDYLSDCWRWACNKQDLMRHCELKIEPIEAVTHCDSCGKDYSTVEYGKICPYCKSDKTWLVKGTEVMIKEIEV